MGDCILTRGLTESVLFAPKPRAEGSSPSAPAKTKRHLWVSFYFVVKAEELEPRNSKVQALLTVNSPVDCLRIELIIKPLPKKAPNFRCFFPLFTAIYGGFACFSHIDKTTAHGFFRTPSFSLSHRFLFTLCLTIHTIRLVHHQKSINHNSNPLVITFSFLSNFSFFV